VREKPSLLQFLHDIADRSGREADRSGERLGPDRHAALEIGLDHEAEDIPHAVGELADGLGHGSDVVVPYSLVIPAKTATQHKKNWVPAFAGMTKVAKAR